MLFGLYSDSLLDEKQLNKLAQHKYSSSGSTLLDPVMQVFWNWFVQKIPLSIAPNLLTITGLIINAFTTIILISYSPDARQEIPSWALLLFALGLFVYQTLDAVDGKQARRTGSSSPLGELFDHGCDSLSTVFVALATCVSVKLGEYPNVMYYQFMAASVLFYTAHWQTYVSGTLLFGKFDVTEAQLTIIVMHIISAIGGVSIWSSLVPILNSPLNIVAVFGTLGGAVYTILSLLFKISSEGGVGKNGSSVAIPGLNIQLNVIPVLAAAVTHLAMTISHFTVIFSGGTGKNGSTVADTSILSPLCPLSIMVIFSVTIHMKSPSNVYESHPCLYLMTFGLAIAKITNKLVVAQMTKHEVKAFDSVMLGPLSMFLNQYFSILVSEYYLLWFVLIFTMIDVLWFARQVCLEIRDHLHINVFSIGPRQPKPQNAHEKPNNDHVSAIHSPSDESKIALLSALDDSSESNSQLHISTSLLDCNSIDETEDQNNYNETNNLNALNSECIIEFEVDDQPAGPRSQSTNEATSSGNSNNHEINSLLIAEVD